MLAFRTVALRVVCCSLFASAALPGAVHAQSETAEEQPATTLRVNTQMVLLDVAVLDRKGRPFSKPLSRDDFSVTEDGREQRIVSFEPYSEHAGLAKNVFVLDALNSSAADKAYYLTCLEQYLRSLPEMLHVPTELLVLNSSSLKVVQTATRNRDELLSALKRMPPSGETMMNLEPEMFSRTLNALEAIAVESLGSSGRTAIVWLGPGSGIDIYSQQITMQSETMRFIRYMTNTLVEGRVTLNVVFPPGMTGAPPHTLKALGEGEQRVAGPYDGGVNFRTLAAQTGGSVYLATNDLASAMRDALDVSRGSYTLGFRPDDAVSDGRFRRLRVQLRDANLRVVTKSGYYAPEQQEEGAPQTIQVFQMVEAGESTLPFHGIPLHIAQIVRSPDGKAAEFTVVAEGKDLTWRPEENGKSLAELTGGGLSLAKDGKKLASQFRNVSMMARSQEADALREKTAAFKLTVPIPSSTDRVRLVVSSRADGRLGCLDVSRTAIDAAPVAPVNTALKQ